MGEGSDLGSTIASGVGLLAGVAIAGAAIKGVSNIAKEMSGEEKGKKGFEGVKPMKVLKVKTPKVPKTPKIPKASKAPGNMKVKTPELKVKKVDYTPKMPKAPSFTGFKDPKTEVKKFVPKSPLSFKPKPFKLNTKVGF